MAASRCSSSKKGNTKGAHEAGKKDLFPPQSSPRLSRRERESLTPPFALKKPRGRGAREGADEGKPRVPPERRGQHVCFAGRIGLRAEKVERIGLPTASTAQSNDLSEGENVVLRRDSVFHNLRRVCGVAASAFHQHVANESPLARSSRARDVRLPEKIIERDDGLNLEGCLVAFQVRRGHDGQMDRLPRSRRRLEHPSPPFEVAELLGVKPSRKYADAKP